MVEIHLKCNYFSLDEVEGMYVSVSRFVKQEAVSLGVVPSANTTQIMPNTSNQQQIKVGLL